VGRPLWAATGLQSLKIPKKTKKTVPGSYAAAKKLPPEQKEGKSNGGLQGRNTNQTTTEEETMFIKKRTKKKKTGSTEQLNPKNGPVKKRKAVKGAIGIVFKAKKVSVPGERNIKRETKKKREWTKRWGKPGHL